MKLFFVVALLIASAAAAPGYYRDIEGFIVGGTPVGIASFPFLVSLRSNNNHICGGSILNARWVVSAAHCWGATAGPGPFSFRAGSTFRDSGGSIFQVGWLARHPNYSAANINNDVGLLQTTGNMGGTNVAAISLAPGGHDPAGGARVHVAGWGATSWQGPGSNQLLFVDKGVVTRATCRGQYGTAAITDNMFCAQHAGRDACQGDSGGPCVNAARNQLQGVVSWGHQCAHPSFAGVYARIGAPLIRNWISNTAGA